MLSSTMAGTSSQRWVQCMLSATLSACYTLDFRLIGSFKFLRSPSELPCQNHRRLLKSFPPILHNQVKIIRRLLILTNTDVQKDRRGATVNNYFYGPYLSEILAIICMIIIVTQPWEKKPTTLGTYNYNLLICLTTLTQRCWRESCERMAHAHICTICSVNLWTSLTRLVY